MDAGADDRGGRGALDARLAAPAPVARRGHAADRPRGVLPRSPGRRRTASAASPTSSRTASAGCSSTRMTSRGSPTRSCACSSDRRSPSAWAALRTSARRVPVHARASSPSGWPSSSRRPWRRREAARPLRRPHALPAPARAGWLERKWTAVGARARLPRARERGPCERRLRRALLADPAVAGRRRRVLLRPAARFACVARSGRLRPRAIVAEDPRTATLRSPARALARRAEAARDLRGARRLASLDAAVRLARGRRLLTPLVDALDRYGVRHADAVRALSPYTAGSSRTCAAGRRTRSSRPSPTSRVFTEPAAAPLPERPTALFVGVLERYKNVDGLVGGLAAGGAARARGARSSSSGRGRCAPRSTRLGAELPGASSTCPSCRPKASRGRSTSATVLVLPSRSRGPRPRRHRGVRPRPRRRREPRGRRCSISSTTASRACSSTPRTPRARGRARPRPLRPRARRAARRRRVDAVRRRWNQTRRGVRAADDGARRPRSKLTRCGPTSSSSC